MLSNFVILKIKPLAVNCLPQIDSVLEKSLNQLCKLRGENFISQERDLFFSDYGKVFSGDLFFEDRMNYFNAKLVRKFDLAVAPFLIHSLFRVKKITAEGLVVQDLIHDCNCCIYPSTEQNLTAFEKGTLFQAFLFEQDENLFLTKALIFHSPTVLKIIRKKLKLQKASAHFDSEKFLMWISHREILYSRHKKIAPNKIYSEEIYPSNFM